MRISNLSIGRYMLIAIAMAVSLAARLFAWSVRNLHEHTKSQQSEVHSECNRHSSVLGCQIDHRIHQEPA